MKDKQNYVLERVWHMAVLWNMKSGGCVLLRPQLLTVDSFALTGLL